jgi:hypothetical protein
LLHTHSWLSVGYRAVEIRGASGPDASASVQFRGPLIGMGFAF